MIWYYPPWNFPARYGIFLIPMFSLWQDKSSAVSSRAQVIASIKAKKRMERHKVEVQGLSPSCCSQVSVPSPPQMGPEKPPDDSSDAGSSRKSGEISTRLRGEIMKRLHLEEEKENDVGWNEFNALFGLKVSMAIHFYYTRTIAQFLNIA